MRPVRLSKIYSGQHLIRQKNKFKQLKDKYKAYFNNAEVRYFSSPGRTEIIGNHTDHNNGKVIAASIDQDTIAVAQKNDSTTVSVYSEGFKSPFVVNLTNLEKIDTELETTNALIRGIAANFKNNNFNIGGFNAVISSDVLQGSGLSSSASIEVLIGHIFNALFNENKIKPVELAKIGQYAENNYFGKPCGLMDQIACAVGNIVAIDFKDSAEPVVQKLSFNFSNTDYKLVVLDSGASHADLTSDYAAIPKEMKKIATYFNVDVCREITEEEFYANLPHLKERVSHRAILRAFHFMNENKRVGRAVSVLNNKNFKALLSIINESGNSSFKYLQNIFTTKNTCEQSLSLALALTEKFLKEIDDGACRVHGGGFAGTIQVFIPKSNIMAYQELITPVFGKNSIQVLNIRPVGVTELSSG